MLTFTILSFSLFALSQIFRKYEAVTRMDRRRAKILIDFGCWRDYNWWRGKAGSSFRYRNQSACGRIVLLQWKAGGRQEEKTLYLCLIHGESFREQAKNSSCSCVSSLQVQGLPFVGDWRRTRLCGVSGFPRNSIRFDLLSYIFQRGPCHRGCHLHWLWQANHAKRPCYEQSVSQQTSGDER